jgi:hypothetical protein
VDGDEADAREIHGATAALQELKYSSIETAGGLTSDKVCLEYGARWRR